MANCYRLTSKIPLYIKKRVSELCTLTVRTDKVKTATYLGHCHCGEVRFEITTDFPELTTCDCSICRMKNALMVKVHEDNFHLIQGQEYLTQYQFHTRTAVHYFCKKCGIYPFHRKRTAPDHYGVNVYCLEGFNSQGLSVRETGGSKLD